MSHDLLVTFGLSMPLPRCTPKLRKKREGKRFRAQLNGKARRSDPLQPTLATKFARTGRPHNNANDWNRTRVAIWAVLPSSL
jgi:hypothetical protein